MAFESNDYRRDNYDSRNYFIQKRLMIYRFITKQFISSVTTLLI